MVELTPPTVADTRRTLAQDWNGKVPRSLSDRPGDMDWPESTRPLLTVPPRGMKCDGGRAGGDLVVKVNPAR